MTYVWVNDRPILYKRLVWVAASLALHSVVLTWLFSRGVSVDSSVRQAPLELIFVEFSPPLPEPPLVLQAPRAQMTPSTDAGPKMPVRSIPPDVDLRTPHIPQNSFETAIVSPPLLAEAENAGPSEAVRQALAKVFCPDMKQDQRRQAGCDDQSEAERSRSVWAPPSVNTQNLIDDVYQRQLVRTANSESFIEQMIARNGDVTKTMFGNIAVAGPLDNTAFMERRDKGAADRDKIAAGQTPSWEADIRRSHGR